MFNLKHSSTSTEGTVSLKEFLNKFADNYDCLTLEQLDIEHYLTKLNEISLPEIDFSQTECLVYIAGYAVFSYLKKHSGRICYGLLTSGKFLEVNNDVGSQYTLIDLVDRGSLKYASRCMVKCVKIVYETILQIDKCEINVTLCKEIHFGPFRACIFV